MNKVKTDSAYRLEQNKIQYAKEGFNYEFW
jgi:hypothetical protein